MECKICNTKNEQTATYCGNCGNVLKIKDKKHITTLREMKEFAREQVENFPDDKFFAMTKLYYPQLVSQAMLGDKEAMQEIVANAYIDGAENFGHTEDSRNIALGYFLLGAFWSSRVASEEETPLLAPVRAAPATSIFPMF